MENIMYYGWQDTTNVFSAEHLKINSCGKQTENKRGFSLLRENGRVDYHILYVLEGKCQARHEGREFLLKPGEGILYHPGQRQQYTFPADTVTSTYWVHFSGFVADKVLQHGDHPVSGFFRLTAPQETERLFGQLVREWQYRQFPFEILCESCLWGIIGNIMREIHTAEGQNLFIGVSPAFKAMHDHPESDLSVKEYADMCNLSKSRFIHIFTAFAGVSPHHYRLRLRIDRAKQMLAFSDMRITEIAISVGFNDPLYFSKAFRKYVGVTPTAYRKQKQCERKEEV